MHVRRRTLAAVLLCTCGAAAFAQPEGFAVPVGPAIGNNKYRGAIAPVDDSDDFVGRFLDGDLLTVSVVAQKAGKAPPVLKPLLTLVDPDGVVRTSGLVIAKNEFAATFHDFKIDKSGLWAARLAAKDGTTGDYLVSFKVRPAKSLAVKKQRLGGDQVLSRLHEFPGFDGVRLDATVTASKAELPVDIRSLADPQGDDVLDADGGKVAASAVKKGHKTSITGAILSVGAGDYGLRVGIPTGMAVYDLKITLKAPPLPAGKLKVLQPVEPFLDPATAPFAGGEGETVRFTGLNFSTSPAPQVLFGATPATSVTVGGEGTFLDVVIPARKGPSVVPVYVVNPDGQGASRDRYFAFIPAPRLLDLVDAATSAPIRSASALGGRAVRLLGANFEASQVVRVGAVTVNAQTLVSDTEFRFTFPPVPDGERSVTVSDVYGRTGTADFTVLVKTPPSFAAQPYTPAALAIGTPTTLTIIGANFLASDQMLFAGQTVSSTLVNATTRTFSVPALPAGGYTVQLVDSIGTVVNGPDFHVKNPPTISAVSVVAGPVLGTTEIPLRGGSTIQVTGTEFLDTDTVTFGGATITSFVQRTATTKQFVAPAGAAAGLVSVTILDGAAQSVTASNVLRYVGLVDTTTSRLPATTSADDLSAARGAAADLDRDGLVDDVVIVSPFGNSPGSRKEMTRVFHGNASGALVDKTSTAVPGYRTDAAGVDEWDAQCLAIGDLDKTNGPDILIGGEVAAGPYGPYQQVRMFKNGGAGTFTLDASNSPPTRYVSYVAGTYYRYYANYYYTVFGPTAQQGKPEAIAIGDLDRDGDLDVVVGTDHFQSRSVYLDPNYVSFSTNPASILAVVPANYRQYVPATRVYDNKNTGSNRLADVTAARLPSAGTSKDVAAIPAALHCRDLVLADVNKDTYVDLIVAWNDPNTVTAVGLNTLETTGASTDVARPATRVLLNNRSGAFPTDGTATWLPAPSLPEMWQADRIAAADLDGNGFVDLVLVTSGGLDAWTGTETHTRRALRVLTNDGTKFTDVSTTVIPAPITSSGEDWRGDALTIRDVNGDGSLDILVSTHAALSASGTAQSRLRVLLGSGTGTGLRFASATTFAESVTTDSGEADDLLFVGDLGGSGKPVLLLLSEGAPATSPSGVRSRAEEWKR